MGSDVTLGSVAARVTDTRQETGLTSPLEPGTRYRCGACGNLTRFDVETRERVRRFWHLDLGGAGRVEHEEHLEVTVDSVACRWCGATDAVEVVHVPASPALEIATRIPAQGS